MRTRFTLFKRNTGIFYMVDNAARPRRHKSLGTRDRAEAQKLVQAHNDSVNQPAFNLALAHVYIAGADPKFATRTWQDVMEHIVHRQRGDNRRRWSVAINTKHFDSLRHLKLATTRPLDFDQVLACRKPSVIEYLRRLHTHALAMEWLLRSILPKPLWPKLTPKRKRAITCEEHRRIIDAESAAAQLNQGSRNSDEPHYHERRDFYELLWHTGASQGDAAFLLAENINWQQCTIFYFRRKLAHHDATAPALIRFGHELAALLQRRPQSGPLFPYLCTVRSGDRATEFKQRCQGLNIEGVTLHSYRYAWAERALKCGYPERFAQQALGHNSKAVHYAYAKGATVIVPSLEDWETHWTKTQQLPAKPYLQPPATPATIASPHQQMAA